MSRNPNPRLFRPDGEKFPEKFGANRIIYYLSSQNIQIIMKMKRHSDNKRKYERPLTRAIEIQHIQLLAESPAGMKASRSGYGAPTVDDWN